MKTLYFKEHEGIVHNPIGQLWSIPSVPWWSAFGSQSAYGESCGQLKTASSVDQQPSSEDQVTIATKQAGHGTERELDNGNTTTQFNIFPGDCKGSAGGQKPVQAFISLQTSLPEYPDLGFAQPMIYAKYPLADPCHGIFSTYGSQVSGRIMLPMNLTTDDGPIYVNAKQYHGIMRRRRSRAKAVLENKLTKKRKPYMHHSRHLHAMRRPRGSGGRFLNTKSLDNGKCGTEAKKTGDIQLFQPTGSQSSEILQSDSGTLNSSREIIAGGSNLTSSEVTSMYSRGDLDRFSINHLAPSFHAFSGMMDTAHGIVMSSKWVAAADNCCNLKV